MLCVGVKEKVPLPLLEEFTLPVVVAVVVMVVVVVVFAAETSPG